MVVFENVTVYGNNVGINVSVHIDKGDFVFLVGRRRQIDLYAD